LILVTKVPFIINPCRTQTVCFRLCDIDCTGKLVFTVGLNFDLDHWNVVTM
jgi:hypothetical protein